MASSATFRGILLRAVSGCCYNNGGLRNRRWANAITKHGSKRRMADFRSNSAIEEIAGGEGHPASTDNPAVNSVLQPGEVARLDTPAIEPWGVSPRYSYSRGISGALIPQKRTVPGENHSTH